MYIRTNEETKRGLTPSIHRLSSSYLGEPGLFAKANCPGYERGEKEISKTPQGHLSADVIPLQRGLLIADFGVALDLIKESTKREKLLQDWLGKIKSDLYSIILRIYGYSDCTGEGKFNEKLRGDRAKRVYALLDKDLQSRVDFIGPARPGEYVADNKTKEGRAKNRGVVIELLPIPGTVINITQPAPRTICPGCQPPIPPPPPPGPYRKVVAEYVFKREPRRIRSYKRLEIFAHFEAEITASVNATDKEFATIKVRWENGQYKPEVELQLVDQLGFDIKVERDKGKLGVKFKRDIQIPGGYVECTPNFQLSLTMRDLKHGMTIQNLKHSLTEPFVIECTTIPKISLPLTIKGVAFRVDVKPKVVIALRINWWRKIIDRIKERITNYIKDTVGDLFDFFGRLIIGSGLRKILAVLAGLVLVKLLLDDDKGVLSPHPKDISGHDGALAFAGGAATAAAQLRKEAASYRKGFATAIGDTLAELTEPAWQTRLDGLKTVFPPAFIGLPSRPPTDTNAWAGWTRDANRAVTENVRLTDDNFVRRYRQNETAMMYALAASLRHQLTADGLGTARRTAHHQAAVAGMAAAVIYVRATIHRETYDFIDETGQPRKRDGIDAWNRIAEIARQAVPNKKERQRRLAGLVTDLLPPLK